MSDGKQGNGFNCYMYYYIYIKSIELLFCIPYIDIFEPLTSPLPLTLTTLQYKNIFHPFSVLECQSHILFKRAALKKGKKTNLCVPLKQTIILDDMRLSKCLFSVQP